MFSYYRMAQVCAHNAVTRTLLLLYVFIHSSICLSIYTHTCICLSIYTRTCVCVDIDRHTPDATRRAHNAVTRTLSRCCRSPPSAVRASLIVSPLYVLFTLERESACENVCVRVCERGGWGEGGWRGKEKGWKEGGGGGRKRKGGHTSVCVCMHACRKPDSNTQTQQDSP